MPTYFIPARSSRHRTACLALYRALVKEGKRVPLPEHVNTCAADKPYVNPIQLFIRRSFRQNKRDTSPRLVTAALDAGHNMLRVLSDARIAGSKENSSVVAFLEKNKPPVHVTYRQWQKKKKIENERRAQEATARGDAPRVPLLTRRVVPGTEKKVKDGVGNFVTTYEYEYVPSKDPKPLSELPGRRRVPRLITEASGIPFLRLRKKQPLVLSKIIQHRRERRATRSGLVSELTREGLDFAAQEDLWEDNLARAVAESGQDPIKEPGDVADTKGNKNRSTTYRQSVALGIAYISAQLNVEVVDMLARSKAYLTIIDRERALAEKEDTERLEKERLEKEQETASQSKAPDAQ
ncbi:ubiquitin-conjugating enzyme [Ophiostoma piceae UAMH 11346]|uniref:Ubiquitin-conjugating enzyme n=1 Tax=Ophiostoma piceae (strain UAMH 11346) TaxID=1262450 RepID=S3CQ84_OPHP1|nr:ubiquitin-conjugating enzyme [Ophiostoma piceae UAMH 11346]